MRIRVLDSQRRKFLLETLYLAVHRGSRAAAVIADGRRRNAEHGRFAGHLCFQRRDALSRQFEL